MVKYEAKQGYEDFFELAKAKKEAFEVELENAKAEAVAKVELEFADKKAVIDKIFADVSFEEEVADEEEFAEEPVAENLGR